jgi:hypothetical protein
VEESGKKEPTAVAQPLDFAAELAKKLANKAKPKVAGEVETAKESVFEAPKQAVVAARKVKNVSSLFDDEEDEEGDGGNVFSSTVNEPVVAKAVAKKSIFEESDDESGAEETVSCLCECWIAREKRN